MNHVQTVADGWWSFSVSLLEPLIHATPPALLLAGIVLLLNLTARRWIPASHFALLWGLVLIRLALPVTPESPLSLTSAWQHLQSRLTSPAPPPISPAEPILSPTITLSKQEPGPEPLPHPVAHRPTTIEPLSHSLSEPLLSRIRDLAIMAFPLIALLILTRTLTGHRLLRKQIQQAGPLHDARLTEILNNCCQQAGIRRPVTIVELPDLDSPGLVGVRSPIILVPASARTMDDPSLRLIILHELGHLKGQDPLTGWSLTLLKAVSFWNPVFWLALSRWNALREQACDAFALKHSPDTSTRQYSELLLAWATSPAHPTRSPRIVGVPLLGQNRRAFQGLRSRLLALPQTRRQTTRWQRLTICSLSLTLALTGLTNPGEADAYPPEKQPREWSSLLKNSPSPLETTDNAGPIIRTHHDVSPILKQLKSVMHFCAVTH